MADEEREWILSAQLLAPGVMPLTQSPLHSLQTLASAGNLCTPQGAGGVSMLLAGPQVGEDLQFNTLLFS